MKAKMALNILQIWQTPKFQLMLILDRRQEVARRRNKWKSPRQRSEI
jgi:hypothetical protein